MAWTRKDVPETGPPYPLEFRREAVALVRSGRSVKECYREPGLQRSVAAHWVKRDQLDRHEQDDGLTSAEREELRRLRRKNTQLKQEREILKRAAAFFATETETGLAPTGSSRRAD
jgi:transposase